MAPIEKKIWPEYFEAVASGKKKFELRLNDFAIAEGDTLLLKEWDPTKKDYTGRTISKKVTYVLPFPIEGNKIWTKEEILAKGLQIISIE